MIVCYLICCLYACIYYCRLFLESFFFNEMVAFYDFVLLFEAFIALCIKTSVDVWKMSHNCIAVWYPSFIKLVGF